VSHDLPPLSPNLLADYSMPNYERFDAITPIEVFHKLSHINVHKSPGPDGLPNWFLRDFAFAISEPICHIFQSSLKQGVVPRLWKMANVVPVPKVNPPQSIEQDLRPISLTSTLSKILESLVGRRILPTITPHIDSKQYGGLRGRSTTHALVNVAHQLHQAIDNRNSSRCLFLDYTKAFDRVNHTAVLEKMSTMGVQNIYLRWMHSFLSNRQQRVKVANVLSDWTQLNGGMPQGTWFGPYVFLIIINDLKTDVPDVQLYKFIDDTTAVETIAPGTNSCMQQVANQIAQWSSENYMIVNTRKTKEMVIGHAQSMQPIKFGAFAIEKVTSFKLLGVYLSADLQWDVHIDSICLKVNRRLHFLKLLKRSSVSTADLLLYYKAVIRPVIDYACPVWQSGLTSKQLERLESLQRRAIRIITGYNCDHSHNLDLFDIELLEERLDLQTRSFFARICRPGDCIHYLLPNIRQTDAVTKLRYPNKLHPARCRTVKFQNSFLPHCLANYQ
jgi:Reverse transcriptase (RNA-dependent DNA polymerase)